MLWLPARAMMKPSGTLRTCDDDPDGFYWDCSRKTSLRFLEHPASGSSTCLLCLRRSQALTVRQQAASAGWIRFDDAVGLRPPT